MSSGLSIIKSNCWFMCHVCLNQASYWFWILESWLEKGSSTHPQSICYSPANFNINNTLYRGFSHFQWDVPSTKCLSPGVLSHINVSPLRLCRRHFRINRTAGIPLLLYNCFCVVSKYVYQLSNALFEKSLHKIETLPTHEYF